MPEAGVRGLTKTFGRVTAVRGMSFGVLVLAAYAIAFAAAARVATLGRDVPEEACRAAR
jgi:hypothetical protein